MMRVGRGGGLLVRTSECAAAVAAVFMLAIGLSTAHGAVGRTLGSFSVSATGEANYAVSIFAPPGTHGMTPKLGLAYGHRIGGEWLGQGWGVTGLSEISRCPKTWAQDGQARAVNLDAYDRFCLDGQQLKLETGTYGANGATYRTEIESYSRVTSYGTAGAGPQYFYVERKDGTIYEYGSTADSRIEALGSATVRTWALAIARDRSNNRIAFNYTEDTSLGSYRISNVQYTSNPTQGLLPNYRLDFVYETQPVGEVESSYLAGTNLRDITRMTRVDVSYSSTLVRRYNLAYESTLSNAGHSRLASVTECGGSAGTDCLAPIAFTYQNGTPGIGASVTAGFSIPAGTYPLALDVNGDGKTDLVYPSSATEGGGTWMIAFANGSGGFLTPVNSGISNTGMANTIPIDYNADGLEDLLIPVSGTWYVALGTTTGFSAATSTGVAVASGMQRAAAFDVNGDGLDDLVEAVSNAVQYRARAFSAAFGSASYLIAPIASPSYVIAQFYTDGMKSRRRLPDFNGGGRYDFIVTIGQLDTSTYTFYEYEEAVLAGGGIWFTDSSDYPDGRVAGDFNGDGLTDFAVHFSGDPNWYYRYSTGVGFTGWILGPSAASQVTYQAIALDWDSDGYEDILVPGTDGYWRLLHSSGTSFDGPFTTGISAGTAGGAATLDINGDGLGDPVTVSSAGVIAASLHSGLMPDLLKSVTDGFGNAVTFTYVSIAQGNCSKGTDQVYPDQDIMKPLYVVAQYVASDGNLGTYTISYWYYFGHANVQGRGFTGFNAVRTFDSRSGMYDYRYLLTTFPYIGTQYHHDVYQPDFTLMQRDSVPTFNAHELGTGYEKRYFPYVVYQYQQQWEVGGALNGALIKTTMVQMAVDAATGTNTNTSTTISESATGNGLNGGQTWTTQTLVPSLFTDTTTWCLGRPLTTQQVQSHTMYNGSSQTRTVGTTWDAAMCRPTQTQLQPGDPNLQVTTVPGYDGFGNVNSEAVTGIGMATRTTTTTFDASLGDFPVSVKNALNQETTMTWDRRYGLITDLKDPNLLIVHTEYDNFGRKILETRPDGTKTQWQRNQCGPGSCDPRVRIYVQISQLNTVNGTLRYDRDFFDVLDRPLYEYRLTRNNEWSVVTRWYDSRGRVSYDAPPFITALYANTYAYDLLNRVTSVSRPISATNPTLQTTSTYYEGLKTRLVDAEGKQKTTYQNAAGKLVRNLDHDGYYQTIDYDAFGNAVRVVDSYANTLQTGAFNIRGMRTDSTDADMGTWSYQYNALGELKVQKDANLKSTSFDYDALGRKTSQTEPSPLGGTITKTFQFGVTPANHDVGRKIYVGISGGGVISYSETYYYDGYGRPSHTDHFDGTGTLAYDYGYNASTGLLETITYPVSTSGYRFKVQYDYQNNRPLRVKDANAPSNVYWLANYEDNWGNTTDETLGNGLRTTRSFDPVNSLANYIHTGPNGGSATSTQNLNYTWDRVGDLLSRNDANQSLTEVLTYDNLHRLTNSALNGTTNMHVDYNAWGNIYQKTGIGVYTYDGTKIHAVRSTVSGLTYTYDNNGNAITKNGAPITWFVSNKPRSISNGSYTSTFEYTADDQYWKQSASYTTGAESTEYIGGLLEVVSNSGGLTSWRHYIKVGGRTVAIYSRASTGATNTIYPLNDHLGSTDAITDSSGTVLVRESFDAFGARRGSAWSGSPTTADNTAIANATRRGFTDHTELDNIALVHMNGRVYDPAIGRFLSADPYIQFPDNTQSFNRYSYVLNNPLSFTDPSGYSLSSFFNKWVRPLVAVAAAVLIPGAQVFAGNALLGSIAGGAVSGAIASGNLKGALSGALGGALFGAAGAYTPAGSLARVAAVSAAGCATSVASGASSLSG
jgi:RHS repeat-associated protein